MNDITNTISTISKISKISPEIAFVHECTKSIGWKLYTDTDTIVFSDNFEALYGIHQPDYDYRFSKFIDRHVANPHKGKIFESIDMYFSGETDIAEISDLSFTNNKHIFWGHARAKHINENHNMLYGVTVDITQRVNSNQEPKQEQADTKYVAACAKTLITSRLSNREQDVINALLDGNVSYKDLSDALCISQHTVKTHLRHIYQITGVPNIPALLSFLHSL